jgi:hypothetical protein
MVERTVSNGEAVGSIPSFSSLLVGEVSLFDAPKDCFLSRAGARTVTSKA